MGTGVGLERGEGAVASPKRDKDIPRDRKRTVSFRGVKDPATRWTGFIWVELTLFP